MPLNYPEFNALSSGTPPFGGRAAGVFAPGCAFGLGATFAPNKKWAVGPLISPPAGVLTATRADKFVCMVIIRRSAGKFKLLRRGSRAKVYRSLRQTSYSPDSWEMVWQGKSNAPRASSGTTHPRFFSLRAAYAMSAASAAKKRRLSESVPVRRQSGARLSPIYDFTWQHLFWSLFAWQLEIVFAHGCFPGRGSRSSAEAGGARCDRLPARRRGAAGPPARGGGEKAKRPARAATAGGDEPGGGAAPAR